VPDIRIDVPKKIALFLQANGYQEPECVLAHAAKMGAVKSVAEHLGLAGSDFWTRASVVESNVNVVFIDVTMITSEQRTPAIQKELAEGIKDNVNQFLSVVRNRIKSDMSIGVLVWIHMKDRDTNFAEIEP
jgi:hypothetical protein